MKSCYKVSLEPSLLQAEGPQLSQPFLIGRCSIPLIIFVALLWTHSNRSMPGVSGWRKEGGEMSKISIF